MRRLLNRVRFLIPMALAGIATIASEGRTPDESKPEPGGDVVTVRFPAELRAEAATGRVLLLMAEEKGERTRPPMGAPFWDDPQPIYSIAVEALAPGAPAVLDDRAAAFPVALSELKGAYRVAAVLDVDRTSSSFSHSELNLVSDPMTLEFDPATVQAFEIVLTRTMPVRRPRDTDRVKLVELKSERLSAFFGRDAYLRAGVVLPPDYEEDAERRYPAVYRVPGFGGRHFGAWWSAFGEPDDLDRETVQIHLDPDGPFGHHLFVNSENNGPVGDALVHELIPHLESRFRLIDRPEARIVTGHSSGGFTSAWLQVNYPETFGGCWATAPDPVDFRAFQNISLYEDANAYVDEEGVDRASVVIDGETVCTVRQENAMEEAMDPTGASGQQWDSWFAAFGPRGDDGMPAAPWDPTTGAMDRNVADAWKRRDLNRLVRERWPEIGPLLSERLRILVGDRDNFNLHLAVGLLKETLEGQEGWRSEWSGDEERAAHGYIEIVADRDHFDLLDDGLGERIEREMMLHFRRHGLLR